MTKSAHINIGGTWTEAKNVWIKQGGVWTQESVPHVNDNSIWKPCMSYGLPYSVQRGTYTWTAGVGTDTINIPTPVTQGKAFIVISCSNDDTDKRDMDNIASTAEFSNLSNGEYDQITVKRESTNGTNKIHWQVIEGEAFTVQTGEITMASTTSGTDAITTIDQTNTFITASYRASASLSDNVMCRSRFSDNSTVSVDREGSGATAYVRYFVVTVEGATVQPFDITLTGTSATETITSVTESNAFMAWSLKTTDEGTASHEVGVMGEFNTSTEVGFTRAGSTTTATISGFVVEWSSVAVQHPKKSGLYNQYVEEDSITAVTLSKAFTINSLFGSGWLSDGGTLGFQNQPMHLSRLIDSTTVRADFGNVTAFGRKTTANWNVVSL